MKTRTHLKTALTLALLAGFSSLHGQDVKVDINAAGGPNASGWTAWAPAHTDGTALNTGTGTFATTAATDGNVDVVITTNGNTFGRNYGTGSVTTSFSAATPAELWSDQFFYNNSAGAPLTITLDDLKAGAYEFTIYSYFNALNPGGSSSPGDTDIFVNSADSGVDATAYGGNGTTYTAAFLEANVSTIGFTVLSDDDTVTIEYRNPTTNVHGLNGFKLVSVGADTTSPELATLIPADDATNVATSNNLVVTFDELIQVGTGDITLVETGVGTFATYDVTSAPELTFGSNDITINPTSDLDPGTGYHVLIDSTAVEDVSSNAFAGISDATTWNFTTDGTAPTITGGYPTAGATSVELGSNISLIFSEDVQKGAGNIIVRLVSNGSAVSTIAVTSSLVVIDGSVVTIDPASDLAPGTEFYLEIEAGAFEDLSGNDFAGISGSGTLSFTTESAVDAAGLKVDLQSNGTNPSATTQTGWQPWSLSESFSSIATSSTFAFTGTTGGNLLVTLTPASNAGARNYELDYVSDPGNLGLPGVWFDQYFFNNNTSSSLTVTLDNLKAGSYQFTSYHYADNLIGDPNVNNDEGTANVQIDVGVGAVDSGVDAHFVSGRDSSIATTSISVLAAELHEFGLISVNFTVANDNDPVDIVYGPLVSGDSFGLNGFRIAEATNQPPAVVSTDPADDATGVVVSTNLVVTFDEAIQPGTGSITLKETIGDGTVATYDVTSASELTFGLADITIDPASDLAPGVGYYLLIGNTAVEDLSGSTFAGISDKDDWNFTTDGTPPLLVSTSPADGATFADTGANLALTLDEDIVKGSGNILIRLLSNGSLVESIDVTTGLVTVSGAVATIDPASDLAPGTEYYVEVPGTAFTDASGNAFAGISGSSTWSFKTEAADTTRVQTTTNGAGTALQAGWILFDGPRNGPSISGTVDGVTVTIAAESIAYGRSAGADGGQYLSVNHVDGDLDNLLSGGRLANDAGDLTLTFSGLPDGDYAIKTYHHSMYDGANSGIFEFDVLLTDANGTGVLVHDDVVNSQGGSVTTAALAAVVTTFSSSGGNDVILAFSPDAGFSLAAGGDQMTLNGFELASEGSAPAATAYSTWAASNGLTEGVNDGQGTDADLGGLSNLGEFGLGGKPLNGNDDGSLLHAFSDDLVGGDGIEEGILTILVRNGANFSSAGDPAVSDTAVDGITYAVAADTTPDVNGGGLTVTPTAPVTTGLPTAPTGYKYVSFYISGAEGYFQVMVESAP